MNQRTLNYVADEPKELAEPEAQTIIVDNNEIIAMTPDGAVNVDKFIKDGDRNE